MRPIKRLPLVLLTLFAFLCTANLLVAQQSKKSGPPNNSGGSPASKPAATKPSATKPATEAPIQRQPAAERRERRLGDEQIDDVMSPELEKILVEWAAHSKKIKSLHGKHVRREFNKTFAIEKVSDGEFFLETPDKGRIDMIAKEPKDGEKSTRKGENREPYALEKGPSERWICNGAEIISMNVDEKTYSREELPEEMRGKNIVHSPLPFLFGMEAEEAKRRFRMSLVSVGKDWVRLKAIPRMDSDRQHYHEAGIFLDTKKYLPTHVQLIDPNGIETTYAFESVVINDSGFLDKIKARFRDPYHPNLKGYTQEVPVDVQPASSLERNGRSQERQAGGPVNRGVAPRRDPIETTPSKLLQRTVDKSSQPKNR